MKTLIIIICLLIPLNFAFGVYREDAPPLDKSQLSLTLSGVPLEEIPQLQDLSVSLKKKIFNEITQELPEATTSFILNHLKFRIAGEYDEIDQGWLVLEVYIDSHGPFISKRWVEFINSENHEQGHTHNIAGEPIEYDEVDEDALTDGVKVGYLSSLIREVGANNVFEKHAPGYVYRSQNIEHNKRELRQMIEALIEYIDLTAAFDNGGLKTYLTKTPELRHLLNELVTRPVAKQTQSDEPQSPSIESYQAAILEAKTTLTDLQNRADALRNQLAHDAEKEGALKETVERLVKELRSRILPKGVTGNSYVQWGYTRPGFITHNQDYIDQVKIYESYILRAFNQLISNLNQQDMPQLVVSFTLEVINERAQVKKSGWIRKKLEEFSVPISWTATIRASSAVNSIVEPIVQNGSLVYKDGTLTFETDRGDITLVDDAMGLKPLKSLKLALERIADEANSVLKEQGITSEAVEKVVHLVRSARSVEADTNRICNEVLGAMPKPEKEHKKKVSSQDEEE